MEDDHLKKNKHDNCVKYVQQQKKLKNYTQKELVLMDTSIENVHDKFYITNTKNLAFNFTHV